MAPEKIIGYVRDAGCILVGLGGITYQTVTGEVNSQLLTAFMCLLGFAGGVRIWQLRPGSTSGGRGQSSRRRASESPSPSSSAEGDL